MDEQAVTAVVEVLDDFVNPFQGTSELIDISNATVAAPEVSHDLGSAASHGETQYGKFKSQRLSGDQLEKKF